jgi:hypothetical protein
MAVTDRRKKTWRTALAFLVAALVVAGAPYVLLASRPSERQLVQQLVQKAKHGLETRSLDQMMDCIAPDYRDDAGLTHADARRIAQAVARNVQKAEVTITHSHIALTGRSALGHFDVNVVLHAGDQAIAWPMKLKVLFEKQRRGWRGLWRAAWVVKSIEGHGLDKGYEELL